MICHSKLCKVCLIIYNNPPFIQNHSPVPSYFTFSQWTTDLDIAGAISGLGIPDFMEVKFFENRANGQSKGNRNLHLNP